VLRPLTPQLGDTASRLDSWDLKGRFIYGGPIKELGIRFDSVRFIVEDHPPLHGVHEVPNFREEFELFRGDSLHHLSLVEA